MGSLPAMGRRNQIHPTSASEKAKPIQSDAPSARGDLNGYDHQSFIKVDARGFIDIDLNQRKRHARMRLMTVIGIADGQ